MEKLVIKNGVSSYDFHEVLREGHVSICEQKSPITGEVYGHVVFIVSSGGVERSLTDMLENVQHWGERGFVVQTFEAAKSRVDFLAEKAKSWKNLSKTGTI